MKFSWQLTNSFLKIKDKSIQTILETLILSGIEVEKVDHTQKDKIIDLSITSNRKEIKSALSLAREISTTTNNKLKIGPIKTNQYKKIISNDGNSLQYKRIHVIKDNDNIITPQWIINSLDVNDKYYDNCLENIQAYIQLKWGITFTIIKFNSQGTLTFANETKNDTKLIQSIINSNINKYKTHNFKLIVFNGFQKALDYDYSNYDSNEFYENYYIDSMNIIKEVNQCVTGKCYESYEKVSLKDEEITLDKDTLNRWLGSYKSNKKKFLPTENIKKTLDNLMFFNIYVKKKKLFLIRIPPYRKHDINNKIDIIEEIGKINEFKNFYNQYRYTKTKGKSSKKLTTINKIRYTLRTLGFNEVVNCSIGYNKLAIHKGLMIHNPISEEQRNLRNNILFNLLENYQYHIKYSNNNLLISEIGKIFEKGSTNKKYKEQQYLGGLIYGPQYNKINWVNHSKEISLYQVKGILETLFKQINAHVHLSSLKASRASNNTLHALKSHSTIGIYHTKTNNLIGTAGKVDTRIQTLNHPHKVYVFEINLEQLIKTISYTMHLDYSKKAYSNYPSIIRDISIPIESNKTIKEVQEQIKFPAQELIESINIFNEYKKEDNNTRFVGIRITYRSLNRTLNIEDIRKIDENLLEIRNNIKSR